MTTRKQDPASKASRKLDILQRRRRLVLLLQAGHTQQEAAAALGVSEPTISGDLVAIKAATAAETNRDYGALLDQELSALAGDEAAMRDKWEATGDVKYYNCIAAIMKRRHELLDLDLRRAAQPGGTVVELDLVLARLGLGG